MSHSGRNSFAASGSDSFGGEFVPIRAVTQRQPEIERGLDLLRRLIRFAAQPLRQSGRRVAPLGRQRRADVTLSLLQLARDCAAQNLLGIDRRLCRPHARQHAEQRVIIFLADGIELVIVAARARHCQALEGLRQHVDLVVGPLDPVLPRVHWLKAVLHHPPDARRAEQRFVDMLRFVAARVAAADRRPGARGSTGRTARRY